MCLVHNMVVVEDHQLEYISDWVRMNVQLEGSTGEVKETVGQFHANTRTFRDFHNRLYRMTDAEREQKSYAYLPQVKSRLFEAATQGCLMAVLRDPWNLVENFFAEGEDFLYVDNGSELLELVRQVKRAGTGRFEFKGRQLEVGAMRTSAFERALSIYEKERLGGNFFFQ